MSALFLTTEEVAELTGIKTGRNGKTRAQLQCDHLRKVGIPFYPTAAGEPKIARSIIEGHGAISDQGSKKTPYIPAALRKAA